MNEVQVDVNIYEAEVSVNIQEACCMECGESLEFDAEASGGNDICVNVKSCDNKDCESNMNKGDDQDAREAINRYISQLIITFQKLLEDQKESANE